MLTDIAFNVSAVLIGLSFLAILVMFVASGILFWHLVSETLRQRREASEMTRRLDAQWALRKS